MKSSEEGEGEGSKEREGRIFVQLIIYEGCFRIIFAFLLASRSVKGSSSLVRIIDVRRHLVLKMMYYYFYDK